MRGAITGVALLLLTGQAFGDVAKGGALSASCAHCHGTDGNSSGALYPNLASQTKEYVYRQIKAFKEGARQNSQMSPMVGLLSDEDMRDLADYYNFQNPARKATNIDAALAEKGKKLVEELQCVSCHQPGYKGANEFPRLARQKSAYLVKQLQDFREGRRTNDGGVMAPTAKGLSDEQIEAIAQYLASL